MRRSPSLCQDFPGVLATIGPPDSWSRVGLAFRFRVIPPLPTWTGPNPASVGRDQVSPGHVALCPTMPPAHTTEPPWSSPGTPSSR